MQKARDEEPEGSKGGADWRLPATLLPFPALRVDREGRLHDSNGCLERECGLDPGALEGRLLKEVASEPESVPARLRMASETGRSPVGIRIDTGSGPASPREFWLMEAEGELWLLGEPLPLALERRAVAAARDQAEAQSDELARVSGELRAANEQLAVRATQITEATAAKARFLATMSHELRTPLNAVLGYAGLLRDGVYGSLTMEQSRAVASIVRRSNDLQFLIDEVLDLSKVETGRLELRNEVVRPTDVLHDLVESASSSAAPRGLRVTLESRFSAMAKLDRGKYRHIIGNLVANALKFTPRGGVVEVEVRPGSDSATFITSVRDTGIGIPAGDLENIFESFRQVDSGNTRRFGGMGVGLALVKRLADLMGGSIDVHSEEGRGTTFDVKLPVEPTNVAAGVVDAVPQPDEVGEALVLAIDDDPEVIALLRDSLAPANVRVVGALNGDRGLELARILRPFAITLDIMMPLKDGWQVLRELKADPALCDIPVVVMSIVAEQDLGFSLGVADYLVKPVDRRILIDVLTRLRTTDKVGTALVVDDDYDSCVMLSDLLRSLGFLVRGSGSVDEALAQLEDSTPDVLFLDLTLPDAEAARILRRIAEDESIQPAEIVAVTPHDVTPEQAEWIQRTSATVLRTAGRRREDLLRDVRNVIGCMPGSPAFRAAADARTNPAAEGEEAEAR